ncbi:MAG TPA: diguanylate cyclase [Kamptonema sp.]|nr:diguanylate cyclase [Kamptonema sp.]
MGNVKDFALQLYTDSLLTVTELIIPLWISLGILLGIAMAVLLTLALYLAQKNHQRAKLVESTNQELCSEIAERKLVQEALLRSQQHSQSLLNWIEGIVWEADPQTFQFTFVSQEAERVSGYPVETWLSEPDFWQNHIHPDDRDRAFNVCATSFKKQTEYEFEYRMMTADDCIIWIRDMVNVITENNHPIKLRGVMMDITKDKQAEIEKMQLIASLRESEERYRAVVEQSAEGIFLIDGYSKQIIEANSSYLNLIGYNRQEILQLTLYDIVNIDRETLDAKIDRIFTDNHLYINETQHHHKNGSPIDVAISISLIAYNSQKVFCIVVHNISNRKQVEGALRESQRLTQRINEQLTIKVNELEQRNDEITLLSHMSDLIQSCLNREEAARVIGQFMPLLFPKSYGSIFMISNSKNLVEAITSWGDVITSHSVFSTIECIALRRGHPHLVEDTNRGLVCNHIHAELLPRAYFCIPMVAQGEAMGVLYLSFPENAEMPALPKAKQHLAVTVARQISLALANIKLHETLQHQSIRDPLTGLFNRRYLEESLERELHRARRTQQPLAICMIDADRFKRFNDKFGHEAGDAVLRELGMFLQKNISASDIACRYGGEELTLILPDSSLEETRMRAEQLREGVKQLQIEHRRQPLGSITVSIGVACFPEHGNSTEALVRAADAALYRAKKDGRDRVVTAS